MATHTHTHAIDFTDIYIQYFIVPSPYFDMHVPRAGPAARNLRVPAIISITLEYKMRVINFITNYVGPAGAHFNLTSKSASQSQSQLELESS